MKILALSDIHGYLWNKQVEEYDVLCLAGDIININDQRNIETSRMWWYTRFTEWVNKQPCKKVIVTPGNHDFYIEDAFKKGYFNELRKDLFARTNGKLEILVNESYTYQGLTFYGCPYIMPIPFQEDKWAFTTNSKDYYIIPDNTDILITHDNPFKNLILDSYIPDSVKCHFFGHWHEGIDDTKNNKFNCSMLNNMYRFKEDFKYIEVDMENINKTKIEQDFLVKIINKVKDELDKESADLSINSLADRVMKTINSFKEVTIDETILEDEVELPITSSEDIGETPWFGYDSAE